MLNEVIFPESLALLVQSNGANGTVERNISADHNDRTGPVAFLCHAPKKKIKTRGEAQDFQNIQEVALQRFNASWLPCMRWIYKAQAA
jgi:hypothetical protein